MARQVGARYGCAMCGAELVYEKPCPCTGRAVHSEICCGQQMKVVPTRAGTKKPATQARKASARKTSR